MVIQGIITNIASMPESNSCIVNSIDFIHHIGWNISNMTRILTLDIVPIRSACTIWNFDTVNLVTDNPALQKLAQIVCGESGISVCITRGTVVTIR